MNITKVDSWSLRIWIAGNPDHAHAVCREYCDSVGFCVSVTPTSYVYTGGDEEGVIVGLINYPRFPNTADQMFDHAKSLGIQLMHQLGQHSFTIETPVETWWFSIRDSGGLPKGEDSRSEAECEASQSGGATSAASPTPNSPYRRGK